MPNWCNNNISITGPKDQITALWERAQTADNGNFGLLNAMVTMPKALEGTTSPSDTPNWYEWRVTNWGTKWDIGDHGLELSEDGSEITGWFDSAWAPPSMALMSFAEKNGDITITNYYYEGGMDFGGLVSCDRGVCEDDYVENIQELVQEGEDNLVRELDDQFGISEQWDEEMTDD